MSLMSLIFKNDVTSKQGGSLCGTRSEIIDTPVNGRPSLFCIDSVHPMETSVSHSLLVVSSMTSITGEP
jgi:hypothetical protein